VLALPLVVLITGRLEGMTMKSALHSLATLGARPTIWGLVCGAMVGTGYMGYFVATQAIAPTITFAVVGCSTLVAILADVVVDRGFRDASWAVFFFLLLSSVLYACTIALLASIS